MYLLYCEDAAHGAVEEATVIKTPVKPGQLAFATGLTVRTLHHYDSIGLLSPSQRTDSGHRLYNRSDIERLHRITCLRRLGLSLQDISSCLDSQDYEPLKVINLHLEKLKDQIQRQQKLCAMLEGLASAFRGKEEVPLDSLIKTMEVMNTMEDYYTAEQLEELSARRASIGQEGMEKGEQQWTDLISAVRAEMAKGTDPADPVVQDLAATWKSLLQAFTGGNPGIEANLKKMYEEKPDIASSKGFHFDPELAAFMSKAMKVSDQS